MNIIFLNYILFIIIILIFYIFKRSYISLDNDCNSYKIYKKILYSDIISQVKSGDLIFFDHTLASIYERSFGHPQFSHIGIIIEINKEIYICDIKCYHKNKIKSINLVPIYEKIYNFNGYVYIVSLKTSLNKNQLTKLKTIIDTNNINYSSKYKIIYNIWCNEFIAYILDELQITNNLSKSTKTELSKNIINLSNSDLYYNPVHIIIDNLIIKKLYNNNYNYITSC